MKNRRESYNSQLKGGLDLTMLNTSTAWINVEDDHSDDTKVIQFPLEFTSSSSGSDQLTSSSKPTSAALTDLGEHDHARGRYDACTTQRLPRRPASVQIVGDAFEDEHIEKKKHAAEPIKSLEDIQYVSQYLIDRRRYRDNLLFIAGINLGLRCGDLLQLKIGHLLDSYGNYKSKVVLKEQKTGKIREAWLNDAVYDAMDLYLGDLGAVDLNSYLFKGIGNRSKNSGQPMRVDTAERLLKKIINEECGLTVHASTHMLRKTFSYHVIMSAPDRSRAIEFLQKILGHSSPAITLAYAGITDDEIAESYRNLNLGKHSAFQAYLSTQQAV